MKSILEEFWYGNIDPQVDATRYNKEVKNLLALMMQNREKFARLYKVKVFLVSILRSLGKYDIICYTNLNLVKGQK